MATKVMPSLIVCGPLIGTPDSEYLSWLRASLIHNADLGRLNHELAELNDLWQRVVDTESSFQHFDAIPMLRSLNQWVTDGGSSTIQNMTSTGSSRNALLSVLTVLAHIVEYSSYLDRHQDADQDAHVQFLDSAREGGIQALCIGLLSAIALACSQDRAEIARNSVIAFRLAFLVGACIDLDEVQSAEPTDSITCRWSLSGELSEEVLRDVLHHYPEAYVSVHMDINSATITARKRDCVSLMQTLQEKGFAAKQIDLQGRFHHIHHDTALRVLTNLCASLPMLQFSGPCRVPLRRNDNGEVAGNETPLHEMALRCILAEKAEWYTTMNKSATGMGHDDKLLLLGPIDCIPRSVLATTPLQVIRPMGTTGLGESCNHAYPDDSIAIIGASCRFGNSKNLTDFWNAMRGRKSTMGASPPQWKEFPTNDTSQQFLGSYLPTSSSFDHSFFRKSPREADYMDPHHRIALELAYEALESGGYFSPSASKTDDVGCYVGMSNSDYEDNVNTHAPTAFSFTGTARAFASGRISHLFGWTGPSMVIDSACSSSAVAIHTACTAIRSGDCSMALAGGVNLIMSPNSHRNLAAASFLSPAGQCRPFDASADGYCRGEGGGFVVLKRLSAAVADNDGILGVLAGSAVNHAKGNASITVPSVESQRLVYEKALHRAHLDAAQVSYVEAHGTGTQKGDPVEFQSIRDVFARPHGRRLRFGSVKGNIGHCEAAAGVAGLVKVLLMLQYRHLPPQAGLRVPNPLFSSLLHDANMEIPVHIQSWDGDFRAACVNSYGASGSNAAMIVCQPPTLSLRTLHSNIGTYPFLITAHSEASLRRNCTAILRLIEAPEHAALRDELLPSISFHLAQRQNNALHHRQIFSATSYDELKANLLASLDHCKGATEDSKPVVLLFAGQTGYQPRLSKEAYHNTVLLKHHLDQCDRILHAMGLRSLFPHIFGTEPVEDLVDLHCMIFSLQYATAASWIDAGLVFKKVLGHSLGQLTALCVSGMLSLRDALRMISGRASLIKRNWGSEPGGMIYVEADLPTVQTIIAQCSAGQAAGEKVEIACYNSRSNHVIVGSQAAITRFEAAAQSSGVTTRRLAISHGFHSRMMDSIMEQYHALIRGLEFRPPIIPIEPCCPESNKSKWANVTPELVARQSREPVYFGEAIERVERELGSCIWLEAGSGSCAINMARRALMAHSNSTAAFSSGESSNSSSHSWKSLRLHGQYPMKSLADVTLDLWAEGVSVQFWSFHASQRAFYRSLDLPPYQFGESHHWLSHSTESKRDVNVSNQGSRKGNPDLVEFVRYLGDGGSQTAAEFSINQETDEYFGLVGGRTVLGHILSPASMYLESAARALSILSASARPSFSSISQVERIKLHAPFGLNLKRRLRLIMRTHTRSGWEFTVDSYVLGNEERTLQLQATGVICCQEREREDAHLGLLHRLIDCDRCQSFRHDSDASVIQGNYVKKVLGATVNYANNYFGIRSITTKNLEAVSDVITPEVAYKRHGPMVSISPSVLDNFILVAEMHASNVDDCGCDQLYVCSGIDSINLHTVTESGQGGTWTVYSKLHRKSDREIVSDLFVFSARHKSLRMTILGIRLSKNSTCSFEAMLDAMDGSGHCHAARAATSRASDASSSVNPNSSSSPETQNATEIPVLSTMTPRVRRSKCSLSDVVNKPTLSLVKIQTMTKDILYEITGVPAERIHEFTPIQDLGVDSLVAIEFQAKMHDVLQIELPIREYCAESMDFKTMCHAIHSKLGSSDPEVASITATQFSLSDQDEERLSSVSGALTPPVQNLDPRFVQLSNLLSDYLTCPEDISPELPLAALGLDSLVAIQLQSEIQKTFGKSSGLVIIDGNSTLSDLCSLVLA